MPAVTIRNLPEATHRALKVRAAHHGRSTEAEMREILETAVRAQGRLLIGSLLSQRRRKIGLTTADLAARSANRDPAAALPLSFESSSPPPTLFRRRSHPSRQWRRTVGQSPSSGRSC